MTAFQKEAVNEASVVRDCSSLDLLSPHTPYSLINAHGNRSSCVHGFRAPQPISSC